MLPEPVVTPPVVDQPNQPGVTPETRTLHPLSLGFEIAHLVRTNLFPAIFASFSAASGGFVGAVIGFAIFGIAILVSVFKYLTFRYTITESNLLIDQGLIFRKHRSVPIERIQNIDSVQNLFHRWLGVAEVRIETASGNEPEATMRVLTIAEVERLRDNLSVKPRSGLGSASSSETSTTAAIDSGTQAISTPAAAAITLLTIPTKRLILAGLISNRGTVLAGIALGYFWQATFRDRDWETASKQQARGWLREMFAANNMIQDVANSAMSGVKAALIVAVAIVGVILLLRVLSALWYILKFHGYQLQMRGDDLLIQCGLLTKVSATVPRSRIQVISVQRSWLARKFGLATVRIETLGGSGKENEDASATVARRWFIPVMSAEELPQVLTALEPGLLWESQETQWQSLSKFAFSRMIRLPLAVCVLAMLAGIGMIFWANAWSGSIVSSLSVLAAVVSVFVLLRKAKSRRFARTPMGFIYRSGTLMQKTSFGFWDRLQDVDLIQTPFDKRWKMARLRLDTAGAGVADHELLVEYLDAEVAEREYHAARQKM